MKGKITRGLLALALVTTVTLGNLGTTIVLAESNNQISGNSIDELLNKLPENYKNYLEVSSGNKIKLDKSVDLNSSDTIEIIVEFNSEPLAVQNSLKNTRKAKLTQEDLLTEHEEFKNSFSVGSSTYNADSEEAVKAEFGYEYVQVFNGISMTVPANEVEKIAEKDMVKTIWSNEEFQLELPEEEISYFTTDGVTPFMHDSLPGIGVDKLHEEGIKGAGIKVGVLDTGVDYNHPDLKDAYKGGYDFIDNDYDPMETTYEDWKESGKPEFNGNETSYYTSHGTHVAGTILGRGANEGVDVSITGVAPEADLYAYRVLGPYGSGHFDGILAAIDQAIEDKMDVINLSLGSMDNSVLTPESISINNCMLYTDTIAVIAAGNAGPGAYTVGSPGGAALGITVGANSSRIAIDSIEMNYKDGKYKLRSFAKDWKSKTEDLLEASLPIEFAGIGSKKDFEGKNFEGKIALIQRGQLAFVEKIANAKAAGAEAVIFYNNVDGDINVYLGESNDYITTLCMDKEQGEALKELVVANESSEEMVTFENIGQVIDEDNELTDFSSTGPVSNYDIKPEITAPGYNIMSTVPVYINDKENRADYTIAYSRMSGTSMATPHVAGLAALIRAEHPEYSTADVKTVMMNTAEPLNGEYSVYQIGAGTINAYEAVKTEVEVQVKDMTTSLDEDGGYIEINDYTGDFSFGKVEKDTPITKNFTVANNSSEDKTFEVKQVFTTAKVTPVENPEAQGITMELPTSIEVKAGNVVENQFTITVPKETTVGIYEGYVILTNTNDESENYRIPFAINVNDVYIHVENLVDMFSLGEAHPYQGSPAIYLGFEVSDRFETLDVLVKDGETDEYIGYIGNLITSQLPINQYFEVGPLIEYGYYTPILKNTKGEYYIDMAAAKLSEDQRYIIEFRGVDKSGNVIIGSDDYFVDSKPPVITMSEGSEPGIYEVEYDENNPDEMLWLNGNVYDDYVDYAKSYGYEISQKDNLLGYVEQINNKRFQGRLALGENGRINIGYTKKEINDVGLARLTIYPMDKAGSGDYRTGLENYAFIKKGTPYISMATQNRNLSVGDIVTVPMEGKYLNDFTFGSFQAMLQTLEDGVNVYELKSVKPTEELQKFLDDNNMEIDIQVGEPVDKFGENYYPITCELKGENIVGISGDMSLLNFEVEVTNENTFAMAQIVRVGSPKGYSTLENISYVNTKGETSTIEVLNTSKGMINSTKSSGLGTAVPEGACDEYYDMVQSLTDMNTKIQVIAPDGSKYDAIIDYEENRGYFKVKDVLAMKGIYKIQVETPGHLSAIEEVKLSYEYGDKVYGSDSMLFQINQYGGDVNGDGVIDIRDALIIARGMGSEIPEVYGICRDINNDGIVDETDLNYVADNFAIVNGMKEDVGIALEELDGVTIENVVEKVATMKDEVGPEITINVEDGKVYNSQVNLEVTSKDYVYSTHEVYVNGELFEGSSLYEDGKYEIKVVAVDDLGNTSEKIVNIGIKTEGPKVVIEGVEDGKTYDSPVKPVITLEKETENTVTLNDLPYDGKEISEEGKYTLKVVSKDIAGNVTEVTVNFEIVKKAVTPEPGEPEPGEPEPGEPNPGEPDPGKPNPGEPGKENPGNTDKENNNKPGNNLPQTGAIVGSTLLGLVGVAVIGAGVVSNGITNKKKKEDNNR